MYATRHRIYRRRKLAQTILTSGASAQHFSERLLSDREPHQNIKQTNRSSFGQNDRKEVQFGKQLPQDIHYEAAVQEEARLAIVN